MIGIASQRPATVNRRRALALAVAVALAWAIASAGVGQDIVNSNGWPSFARFWRTAADPELSGSFLRLTLDAAAMTMAMAVLGTALALLLGALGALATSEVLTDAGIGWRASRTLLVFPRAIHEIIWALLLIQILGFDPLVAVLAIGIPFGAVTAKVFAETIDEADRRPYDNLRRTGAGRLAALTYGILPTVRGELVSYSFYRLECAIRAAAVLGVIGVAGLGFQLDLSFESLRYREIWTLVFALMILSGLADAWSSTVRRSTNPSVSRASLVLAACLLPIAWIVAGIDLGGLWSPRTRRLAGDLLGDLLPPRLGPGGWSELMEAARDTVVMSILALSIAAIGGLVFAALVRRPTHRTARRNTAGATGRFGGRLALLLFRSVPAPIWAFLLVLVLYPGLWPGAVALGVYNLGVLGRLYAETLEDCDTRPTDSLVVSGATPAQAFFYASLPVAGSRLASLTLYRWEVITRETVVVGVVGAGGLGQLINEDIAARDFAAVAAATIALICICLAIDGISATTRRLLR